MARFNTKRETLQRERERKGYVVSPKKENERVLEREVILVVPSFTHVCGSSDCAGCVWPWMMAGRAPGYRHLLCARLWFMASSALWATEILKKFICMVGIVLLDSWKADFAHFSKKHQKNLISGIANNQKSFLTFAPGR